jgi:hypothetical protein
MGGLMAEDQSWTSRGPDPRRPATIRTRIYAHYLYPVVALSLIAAIWTGWWRHDFWIMLGAQFCAVTGVNMLAHWEFRWLSKRAERFIAQQHPEQSECLGPPTPPSGLT